MYPLLRAAICVVVRDLIVYSVLADMMFGRPVVYATLSSYDEVAHHSGLERPGHARGPAQARPADRPDRSRPSLRTAARITWSCCPTTARRRGRRSSSATATRSRISSGARSSRPHDRDRRRRRAGRDRVARRRTRRPAGRRSAARRMGRRTSPTARPSSSGSGNLGLVYLMEEERRLTLEEIDERHPRLIPALREHPHVGWLLVHSDRARPARARRARDALPRRRPGRRRGPARLLLGERARRTCVARTASRTSPTSWSGASTTPTSTRAAPSRS